MKLEGYLKDRRLELGLTLEEVADHVGVAISTVSRWEQGNIKHMKRNHIVKYAEILQVSPALIMGWNKPNDLGDLEFNVKLIQNSVKLSDPEMEVILAFRELDETTKKSVVDRLKKYAEAFKNLKAAQDEVSKLDINLDALGLDNLKKGTEG